MTGSVDASLSSAGVVPGDISTLGSAANGSLSELRQINMEVSSLLSETERSLSDVSAVVGLIKVPPVSTDAYDVDSFMISKGDQSVPQDNRVIEDSSSLFDAVDSKVSSSGNCQAAVSFCFSSHLSILTINLKHIYAIIYSFNQIYSC